MKIKDGLLALGCALVFACGLRAETNSAPPRVSAQRFLFVVDTSGSTKKIDAGIRQALFDLIYFGIDGQMKKGDTFGIWTYNDQVTTGKFPMMTWDPEQVLPLASAAGKFLEAQKLSGDSDPMTALGRAASVVRNVKDLNIFLITDGRTPLARTAYDHQVNPVYAQRKREVEKNKKPFITTFVARGGQVTNASVTLAGEPILLPPPSPPQPKQIVQRPKASAATNLARTAGMTTVRRTNSTPLVIRPGGATFSTALAPAAPPTAVPAPQPSSEEPPESSIADPAGFIGSNEALRDTATAQGTAAGTNRTEAATGTTAMAAIQTSSAPQTAVSSPKVAAPPSAETNSATQTDAIAHVTSGSNKTTAPAGALSTVFPPTRVAARELAATAAESVPQAGFSSLILICAGAVLLLGSLALFLFGVRRTRMLPSQPSFISQSMERH
jgi:hypothetical protein